MNRFYKRLGYLKAAQEQEDILTGLEQQDERSCILTNTAPASHRLSAIRASSTSTAIGSRPQGPSWTTRKLAPSTNPLSSNRRSSSHKSSPAQTATDTSSRTTMPLSPIPICPKDATHSSVMAFPIQNLDFQAQKHTATQPYLIQQRNGSHARPRRQMQVIIIIIFENPPPQTRLLTNAQNLLMLVN